jgi:hypothetical protein
MRLKIFVSFLRTLPVSPPCKLQAYREAIIRKYFPALCIQHNSGHHTSKIGFIINAPLPTDSNKILARSESILVPVSRTCSTTESTLIPEDVRPKYLNGIDRGE